MSCLGENPQSKSGDWQSWHLSTLLFLLFACNDRLRVQASDLLLGWHVLSLRMGCKPCSPVLNSTIFKITVVLFLQLKVLCTDTYITFNGFLQRRECSLMAEVDKMVVCFEKVIHFCKSWHLGAINVPTHDQLPNKSKLIDTLQSCRISLEDNQISFISLGSSSSNCGPAVSSVLILCLKNS